MSKPVPQSVDPAKIRDLTSALIKKVKFPQLATIDGDQPRVRPVSPVRTDGFTVYVANLNATEDGRIWPTQRNFAIR